MSCPEHPEWMHDREDCPMCSARRQAKDKVSYLYCMRCGKQVSSGFHALPTEMGNDIVVRAWIECPECIGLQLQNVKDNDAQN